MADEVLATPKEVALTRHRARKDILESAQRRVATIMLDMTYAAEPVNTEWSARRKKVHLDANLGPKEAPVYLKYLASMGASMVRAEGEAGAGSTFNVLVLGSPTKTKEEWKAAAAELQSDDEKDVSHFVDVKEAP